MNFTKQTNLEIWSKMFNKPNRVSRALPVCKLTCKCPTPDFSSSLSWHRQPLCTVFDTVPTQSLLLFGQAVESGNSDDTDVQR